MVYDTVEILYTIYTIWGPLLTLTLKDPSEAAAKDKWRVVSFQCQGKSKFYLPTLFLLVIVGPVYVSQHRCGQLEAILCILMKTLRDVQQECKGAIFQYGSNKFK